MRSNKIGAAFLVTVLALAGIGISYAGFADIITIYGSVDTGTVTIDIEDYSGTDVWKVWNDTGLPPVPYDNEVYIWRGLIDDRPTEVDVLATTGADHAKLIASAWATPGTVHNGIDYDVDMVWDNIFPCIDFTADIIIHYTGSIPAHVTVTDLVWMLGEGYYDFSQYTTFEAYSYTWNEVDQEWIKEALIDFPVQMHNCQYVGIEVTIHLPQNNNLQGLHGQFRFNIKAIQWNDQCEPTTDGKIIEVPEGIFNATFNGSAGEPSPVYGTYLDANLSGIPPGNPNIYDGLWPCWCVDWNTPIILDTPVQVELYSSYDPLIPYQDEDWDLVNWIINHKNDYPNASYFDIQAAIWYFIDGGLMPNGTGAQIVADAQFYGENFVPQTGQLIAVLLWPIDPNVQKTIIEADP